MKALNRTALGFDSSSIANTKSSKTLKSKINNNGETQAKFQPPYFKSDKLILQIEDRARKQNLRSEVLLAKPRGDHLKNAGKIVQDLLRKHKEAKEKLCEMKREAERKTEKECPFQPAKKRIEKYQVGGDVVRRNENWLLTKKRKEVERKENVVMEDLSECTFSPTFISRKTSQIYLRNRSQSQQKLSKTKLNETGKGKGMGTPSPSKSFSKGDFEMGRRRIEQRIFTMQ